MRLVCPSCAAEYEIADAAIGPRGRMVRCASCAAEWFQAPVAAAPAVEAPVAAPPQPTTAPDAGPAPAVEAPPIADALPQPEPLVETPADPVAAVSPDTAVEEAVASIPPAAPASEASMAAFSALREGLKDPAPEDPPFQVEERAEAAADAEKIHFDEPAGVVEGDIVIEQHPSEDRQTEAAKLAASLRDTQAEAAETGGGGAFLAGFATVTLLSLVAIAAYVKAPDIAAALPAAAGPLAAYAEAVDQGRLVIASFIRG